MTTGSCTPLPPEELSDVDPTLAGAAAGEATRNVVWVVATGAAWTLTAGTVTAAGTGWVVVTATGPEEIAAGEAGATETVLMAAGIAATLGVEGWPTTDPPPEPAADPPPEPPPVLMPEPLPLGGVSDDEGAVVETEEPEEGALEDAPAEVPPDPDETPDEVPVAPDGWAPDVGFVPKDDPVEDGVGADVSRGEVARSGGEAALAAPGDDPVTPGAPTVPEAGAPEAGDPGAPEPGAPDWPGEGDDAEAPGAGALDAVDDDGPADDGELEAAATTFAVDAATGAAGAVTGCALVACELTTGAAVACELTTGAAA